MYRLIKTRYVDTAFDGFGAKKHGGRWNSKGTPLAYASDSIALAALELLVQEHNPAPLAHYTLCSIEIPEGDIMVLGERALPQDWRANPIPESTGKIGDGWVAKQPSLALVVPSAVIPMERNYLINPEHPGFEALAKKARYAPFEFDPRLIR